MAAPVITGRTQELASIAAWLEELANGPAVLTLAGEMGIGKTTLWWHGVEAAGAAGTRVLVHRGVQAEVGLSFAGLTDLVSPVLSEVSGRLAPPRRQALEVALLLAEPEGSAPDVRAVGLALLDVLQALASEAPLVLALDDVQWLDASSAAVLAVALRRVTGPVGTIATLRPDAKRHELAEVFAELGERRMELGPIGLAELHELLARRVGVTFSPPQLRQLQETSGGNPYFALELAVQRHERPEDARVPASLQAIVGCRLERLSSDMLDALVMAASAARPTVSLLVAASTDAESTRAALETAAREGVVLLAGDEVRFAHPLLASLCYERALPWRRRDIHRCLAEVVADPEERARHLALGCDAPDARVALELEIAAERAAARGAPAAAAELAELSVRTTEATDRNALRRRGIAAAGHHHRAGEIGRAATIYEDLLAHAESGEDRAELLYGLAYTGRDDLPARTRLCEQALDVLPTADPRAAEILGYVALLRWLQGDARGALGDGREALLRAERLGDPRALAIAGARVGLLETWAFDVTPGQLEQAVEIEATLERPLGPADSPTLALARRLYDRDELDEARTVLEGLEARAVIRGDAPTRAWALLQLIGVERQAGAGARAWEHALAARDLAEQTHDLHLEALVARATAIVAVDRGHANEARQRAEEGLRLAHLVGDETLVISNLAAHGYLELALGDARAAADLLRDLPARQIRVGHTNPGTGRWADAVEALVKAGDIDAAREVQRRLGDVAAHANRWARIGSARAAGLVAAAEGDVDVAEAVLEQALREDEPPTYPIERARTYLALGAVCRRAKRRGAARDRIHAALAIFETLDAPLWAQQARTELGRVSGRTRADGGLTATEARVAELVATGLTNREVGAELYLTARTVEAALTRIYRKLDVRSRAELAHLYTSRASGDDEPPRQT